MSGPPGPELLTERLLLRRWREADLPTFAAMNADPRVMGFFPRVLDRDESDSLAHRFEYCFDERGYGMWAVEVREDGSFAGSVGLAPVEPPVPCAPAVEVGWRLALNQWRRGFATEAARAALNFGFDECGVDEIVSLTAAINLPSRGVMEGLGMIRDHSGDFDHPRVPWDSPLRPHVLYRLRHRVGSAD